MARKQAASRESVAYEQCFTPAAPQETNPAPLRVVSTGRRKKRAHALRAQQLACFAVALAIAGTILYSQMTLTRLTSEVAAHEGQLADLSNEYVSLKAQQDRALSLGYVEDCAQNRLGMVKMDSNRVEYVEMNNPDCIEMTQQTTNLSGMVAGLAKSLSAVLEYLK